MEMLHNKIVHLERPITYFNLKLRRRSTLLFSLFRIFLSCTQIHCFLGIHALSFRSIY